MAYPNGSPAPQTSLLAGFLLINMVNPMEPKKELNKTQEKAELRRAAQLYWESNPKVTLPMVAEQFGVAIGTVNRWTYEGKWKKQNAAPVRTIAKKHVAMVRRQERQTGEVMTGEEIHRLAAEKFLAERHEVANKISHGIRLLDMSLTQLGVAAYNESHNSEALDGMRIKAATIAGALDAKLRAAKQLTALWGLDKGAQILIDDGLNEAELKAKKALAQANGPLPKLAIGG